MSNYGYPCDYPSPKKENVASALEEPHMYPDVV